MSEPHEYDFSELTQDEKELLAKATDELMAAIDGDVGEDEAASDDEHAHDGEPAEEIAPALPQEDTVLFPFTMTSLVLSDEGDIRMVEDVVAGDRLVVFLPLIEIAEDERILADVGCEGRIVKMLRFPDETVRVLVRGTRRVKIIEIEAAEEGLQARFVPVPGEEPATMQAEALARNAKSQFQEIISLSPNLPEELRVALLNIDEKGRLADLIADTINLNFEERTTVLRSLDIEERLGVVTTFMAREISLLRLGHEIQSNVNNVFIQQQREHFLREQLRAIQDQLGEPADTPEVTELREQLDEKDLPHHVREAVERELNRINRMHPAAGDYNVARTYVEWLTELPWQEYSEDRLDLGRAQRILDRDHFDLVKIKERIVEHLAVMNLKPEGRCPILCLVGPPGVGKTSLGESVARAMGREFVRISLGGIRDEAEIRGHRRTYVGALPGRIIQGIRKAGTANPVFMLDEIDKLGNDFRGDPASALLEVLDPQQNKEFSDHYLEIAFDLSRVMFITTANLLDPIPPALLDRMEVLRIPGYTQQEKKAIARRYLLPRQLDETGLTRKQFSIKPTALDHVIRLYTREAGVRELERSLGTICRKHARKIVLQEADPHVRTSVGPADVAAYLGPPRQFADDVPTTPIVGVATGLAWTAAGGETLLVEVTTVPGSGKLVLTGSLGDVMKESGQIAFTFVRHCAKHFGIDDKTFKENDFHVHIPAGATPKEGPSAGIALATALVSRASGRPVAPGFAMTGELSLRGEVLPVGGIKEKALAAYRARIGTVFIPRKNLTDLEEVPDEVREKLHFEPAGEALPVIQAMLAP